jgi:hypothetical protein
MDDDRCHEHRRRVEVQDGRNDRVQDQQRGEQDDWPAADALDARAEGREQTIGLDDRADQQQPGDQNKRRPGLTARLQDRLAHSATLPGAASRLASD